METALHQPQPIVEDASITVPSVTHKKTVGPCAIAADEALEHLELLVRRDNGRTVVIRAEAPSSIFRAATRASPATSASFSPFPA